MKIQIIKKIHNSSSICLFKIEIQNLNTKFKLIIKKMVSGHFRMVVTLFEDIWVRSPGKDVFALKKK